jgi:hypothetical protein
VSGGGGNVVVVVVVVVVVSSFVVGGGGGGPPTGGGGATFAEEGSSGEGFSTAVRVVVVFRVVRVGVRDTVPGRDGSCVVGVGSGGVVESGGCAGLVVAVVVDVEDTSSLAGTTTRASPPGLRATRATRLAATPRRTIAPPTVTLAWLTSSQSRKSSHLVTSQIVLRSVNEIGGCATRRGQIA